MPIKVRCPSCKKVLTAPDAARGKAVRCSGCQGVVKIPASAPSATKAKKPAENLQDSTEMLLSIRAMDAIDRNAKVCPKCGADMDEEQTECSVCGIDITTGEMGRTAQKSQKKALGANDFNKFVWSDAKKFVGKNKNLMFQTMWITSFRVIATILAFAIYLWCYRLPPKFLSGFVTLVSFLAIFGWPWYLFLKVVDAALDKKDRIKRVHSDYFASVSLGVKFFAWLIVFGLPMVLLGFVMLWVFRASGQAMVGTFITAAAMIIIYLPFPIVMAHMAMPVQNAAWLVPKMFSLFWRLLKPTLYWWVVVTTVNLPLVGGIAAVGAVYGPTVAEMVTDIEKDNDAWRAWFYKTLEKGGKDTAPPAASRNMPDLTKVIVPVVVLIVCSLYSGFSSVYSIRATALYVVAFKKSLDLTSEAPEQKFIPKSKTPTRKVRPVSSPALNGILVVMGLSILPVMGVYLFLIQSLIEFEDTRMKIVLGAMFGGAILFCIAGKWVAFQKFGRPGWKSAIPIYNAVTILDMAGWDGKYALAFVFFPWVRKMAMNDVADRWGLDKNSYGLGLTFLPFFFWPMLGWGKAMHSDCYVPKEWALRPAVSKKKKKGDDDEEED